MIQLFPLILTDMRLLKKALENGADIINDVWGLQYDKGEMAAVAAKYDVPVIVMHNQNGTHYEKDIMVSMREFLKNLLRLQRKMDFLKIR